MHTCSVHPLLPTPLVCPRRFQHDIYRRANMQIFLPLKPVASVLMVWYDKSAKSSLAEESPL